MVEIHEYRRNCRDKSPDMPRDEHGAFSFKSLTKSEGRITMGGNLFLLSLADIFSVYPQIFSKVLASGAGVSKLYLPSDADWQDKTYYMLLEVQKSVNVALDSGKNYEEVMRQKERPIFDSSQVMRFSPVSSPTNGLFERSTACLRVVPSTGGVSKRYWSMEDISKAAKLLCKPPEHVAFSNEHEMRRVYSLIYDVFRYKSVLRSALTDVRFYDRYPEYLSKEMQVWLMLFELYKRLFQQRGAEDIRNEIRIYEEANIKYLSDCLWKCRKKLAASISKMRIRFGALKLTQLLPVHLQNEKVARAATNPIIKGWINPFRTRNRAAAEELMRKNGFTRVDENNILSKSQFKWDNVCPLFLSCIPHDRNEFAKSNIVLGNIFIIQDRAFSVGPAVMSRLLDYFDLSGDILQTHIDSPRSTAYLAALFYSVNRINCFYVYGAGSNLKLYRNYIEELGINNIRLFAESFTAFPLESNRFRTVVGVFANPPCSFSAISDPIDLICSRGGDLGMLQTLTDTAISEDGKYRVSLILEEQLKTLCMIMSRPQVQFLLYQTHSIVSSENECMVESAVNMINEAALKKHYNLFMERRRQEALDDAESANIPSAALNSSSPRKRVPTDSKQVPFITTTESEGDSRKKFQLPDSDQFVIADLPDVCKNQDMCLRSNNSDCFLSLVQRKQITRLNAKYLILMAERRGLFGNSIDTSRCDKQRQLKIQETHIERTGKLLFLNSCKRSAKNINVLVARLSTSTSCSLNRSNMLRLSWIRGPIMFNHVHRICRRYPRRINRITSPLNFHPRRQPFTSAMVMSKTPYPMHFVQL